MKPSTSALALEQPVITKDRVDDALKSPQLQRKRHGHKILRLVTKFMLKVLNQRLI